MPWNYYCLVAGLREFIPEGDHKGFDARAIRKEIRDGVSPGDRRYIDLFSTYIDIENILNLRRGGFNFNELGNFPREKLEEELQLTEAHRLPKYLLDVLAAYADPKDTEFDHIDRDQTLERALFEAYYNECARSRCEFIRDWGQFDRNMRNVSAALTARRIDRPVEDVLVGEGYVVDRIRRSSAIDFGIKGEVWYIDRIIASVLGDDNILEQEHRIDRLRWEMADELTLFDYFNIDRLLGYLVKVGIIHRWMSLDLERGEAMFLRLMESFDAQHLLRRAEGGSATGGAVSTPAN